MIIDGTDIKEEKKEEKPKIKAKEEKKKDDPFDISSLEYKAPYEEMEFLMDDVPDDMQTTSILLEVVENIENLRENI